MKRPSEINGIDVDFEQAFPRLLSEHYAPLIEKITQDDGVFCLDYMRDQLPAIHRKTIDGINMYFDQLISEVCKVGSRHDRRRVRARGERVRKKMIDGAKELSQLFYRQCVKYTTSPTEKNTSALFEKIYLELEI
jgi:hypothetical protein